MNEPFELVTFNMTVTMKVRWVPHFLGMLKLMQSFGSMGCSRVIGFYADGDGDFRPKFTWDSDSQPKEAIYSKEKNPEHAPVNVDYFFDAG
jgi:hypothetical protein